MNTEELDRMFGHGQWVWCQTPAWPVVLVGHGWHHADHHLARSGDVSDSGVS